MALHQNIGNLPISPDGLSLTLEDVVRVAREHYQVSEVEAGSDIDRIVACSFVALLRFQTFSKARENSVGIPVITLTAQAYSEYWYVRLKDRLDALSDPDYVPGTWIH